ncbi:MAG: flagellar filament capping protein FliD [Gammaproteobacteria bacterium]|nr:flagellar filament capping protein FliD [Gammaproteobacteria bacterium]MDH5801321.1 flagellar filament capping protein FliD [Gammaproteobacteria bacterium]
MAGISAAGVGSGLDVESIISSLMAVERQPLRLISQRQSEIQAKISAFGSLKSAMSKFQDSLSTLKNVSSFQKFATVSSDESVFTATAASNAVAGRYTISFLNSDPAHQLAKSHKMNSSGFADSSTATGVSGTMEVSVNGTSFSINVDNTNDSLDAIRSAINSHVDNDNLVTATIINVDDGLGGTESRLLLTSDETGEDNSIALTDTTGNVAAGLGMATAEAAQNAVFSLDGYTVTSQTNVIKDAIQGITVTLEGKSDTAQTLNVSYDKDAVKESINEFVAAYNELVSTLKTLRSGELKGDNSVISIESQLRSVFNSSPGLSGNYNYLSEIGIKTNKQGELSVDNSELDSALATSYADVAELLGNNDQGYVFRLDTLADQLLGNNGIIKTKNESLNTQIDNLKDRRADVEYRLELIEQRYRKQFGALDSLLANLTATGNYLSQQLANLPGPRTSV